MASRDDQNLLESWLNFATDPNNRAQRQDCVQGFYQVVNWRTNGPQVALRLLADKIKSHNNREALQALDVLQACMDHCGLRFQSEATGSPFVDQLVRILEAEVPASPQNVRDKVAEILYRWRSTLEETLGMEQIYVRLKARGVIEKDPELEDVVTLSPPRRNCMFDCELLEKLLKSGRPEDLEAANQLIRTTFQEDQEKREKRQLTVMQVKSCVEQLRQKSESEGSTAELSQDTKDLYETCEQLLQSLQSLTSDTEDQEGLAEIMAAKDELTLVLSVYKERVRGSKKRRSDGEEEGPKVSGVIKSYHLIDLSALDSDETDADTVFSSHVPEKPRSYSEDLIQLNGAVDLWSIGECEERGPLLRSRGCGPESSANRTSPKLSHHALGPAGRSQNLLVPGVTVDLPASLKDVSVKMETIRPSALEPLRLLDQGGVHASLHLTRDSPRPDVAVAVIYVVNTSAVRVEGLAFMAAVQKTMAVKLQPASATSLPAYNPLLPPAAISQVLLLSNPHANKVRLRYKLSMTHGDQQLNKSGEILDFPDWSAWKAG